MCFLNFPIIFIMKQMKQSKQLVIKLFLAISAVLIYGKVNAGISRPNILLIVADDLNFDSPGYAGGVAPDVTPNIDRLARESFSFEIVMNCKR